MQPSVYEVGREDTLSNEVGLVGRKKAARCAVPHESRIVDGYVECLPQVNGELLS
jgi:hypothetical protein